MFSAQPTLNIIISPRVVKKNKIKTLICDFNDYLATILSLKGLNLWSTKMQKSYKDVDWKCTDCLYGFLILAILIIAPCSITLLPFKNVFENPESWYEIMFASISVHFFLASSNAIIAAELFSEIIKKSRTRLAIELFITLKITDIIATSIVHIIWSNIMGYIEPVPNRYTLVLYLSIWAMMLQIRYAVPKEARADPAVQKRVKALMFYVFWATFVTMQLLAMWMAFSKVPKDFQWMVALVVPLKKEINDRIVGVVMTKTASTANVIEAKFIGKISINVIYAFWIAVILANQATKVTECVLLGVTFLTDMALCYKTIRLDKKVSCRDDKSKDDQNVKKEALTELVLNEIVEVIVPIAFMGSFLTAYYGPNKNVLGNVGCAIWHYKKVEDISAALMPVAEMALIDSGSVMVAGGLLWWFRRINLWKEYCTVVRKYWVYLAFRGGVFISGVGIITVNFRTISH